MILGIVIGFFGCLILEYIVLRLLYWCEEKVDKLDPRFGRERLGSSDR